jgi:hypothetical protein
MPKFELRYTLCTLPLRKHVLSNGLSNCCALAWSLPSMLYCMVYQSGALHTFGDSRNDCSTLLTLSLLRSIDGVVQSCRL